MGGHAGSGEGAHRTDECHRHSRQKIHLRKAVGGRKWRQCEGDGNFPMEACRAEGREER